jgi:hypothetical protein
MTYLTWYMLKCERYNDLKVRAGNGGTLTIIVPTKNLLLFVHDGLQFYAGFWPNQQQTDPHKDQFGAEFRYIEVRRHFCDQ